MGKAVSKVCRVAFWAVGSVAYAALVTLFPRGSLPPPIPPSRPRFGAGWEELRERLVAHAAKQLQRWPFRVSSGRNGSRFEHWASVYFDDEAWEATGSRMKHRLQDALARHPVIAWSEVRDRSRRRILQRNSNGSAPDLTRLVFAWQPDRDNSNSPD